MTDEQLKNDFESILYWSYLMMTDGEGGPDLPFDMMKKYNLIDENEEWIYDD